MEMRGLRLLVWFGLLELPAEDELDPQLPQTGTLRSIVF
jgi:hypothetical protein